LLSELHAKNQLRKAKRQLPKAAAHLIVVEISYTLVRNKYLQKTY
jgi:hypothetical protein